MANIKQKYEAKVRYSKPQVGNQKTTDQIHPVTTYLYN